MTARATQGRGRREIAGALLLTAGFALAGCAPQRDTPPETAGAAPAHVRLTSSAFTEGAAMPASVTCDGFNTSPDLSWEDPSLHAIESYTVILDDPDAPGGLFTHWVLFNVSPSLRALPAGLSQELTLPRLGATHGRNDFGTIGYGGPCPPKGQTHRYRFHLYALDTRIALGPNVSRAAVDQAMRGHIVAEGSLTGTYAH